MQVPYNELLRKLGFTLFEPYEQEEMLLALSSIIFRGSLVRMVERMDEKTREDFSHLCARGVSDEEMAAFIEGRVPDAQEAIRETIQELEEDVNALDIPATPSHSL